MWWLWGIFTEFAEAVARGDRSWWPFVIGAVTLVGAGLALGVLL